MPAEKIKLLNFMTDFNIGGTERQVLNFAGNIDSSRFELHLACFRRRGGLAKEIEEHRLHFQEYEIDGFLDAKTFWQQLRLARYLRRHRIQIVHAYGFYANVFALPAAALSRAPLIVASIRDTGDLLTPAQQRVQKVACRFADRIVANAEAVRQRLIADGYDPAKIAVIRNGIALSRFESQKGNLRQEFSLPAGAPLVAVVSRLNQLKGIEHFLEAAAVLAERFPKARFLVVGYGISETYRKELEAYTHRLRLGGRVVFTGFRLDVPQILAEVAVSVLPSLSEGLSNALLESMAAGVPVVATRVGGNPEIVEEGVTGLLVPPRDSGALARAVGAILEDTELASRLGRAGRERVTRYFSVERMVRETERFYIELLEATRKGSAELRRDAWA